MKAANSLAALAVAIPLGVLQIWMRALVLLSYVGWFVAPAWTVPSIPVGAAMGLLMLPQVFGWKRSRDENDEGGPWQRLANSAFHSIATSGALYVVGALIWWLA
jgi:hypothetical protein